MNERGVELNVLPDGSPAIDPAADSGSLLEVDSPEPPIPLGADARSAIGSYGRGMRSPEEPGFWLVGRFTPRQVDWIVVGAAAVLSVPATVHAAFVGHRSLVAGLAILPFSTVPLLWRRSRPGAVLVALAVALGASALFVGAEPNAVGLLFGMFAAALYGSRRVRMAAGVLAGAALAAAFAIVLATGEAKTLGHLAGTAFGSGVAWVLGDRTRTRRAYLAGLQDRAARLEREQEEQAHRAAEQERTRIARELHDVVAHNVSVIAVHAGAARITAEGSAGHAAEAFGIIERTARSTLTEIRTLPGRRGSRSATCEAHPARRSASGRPRTGPAPAAPERRRGAPRPRIAAVRRR